MLHAFTRLVKIGRNFGIGVSLLSQRPQEVNKKVLTTKHEGKPDLTRLLWFRTLTWLRELT